MTSKRTHSLLVLMLGIVLLVGCDEKDRYKEAARVAEKAADRQAEQNTEMAQLNREVAEGTKRMVTADAEARKEIVVVHQELQAERVALNDGFDELESERKQIAAARRTESMLVPAAKAIGLALVAVIVVGFCWTLLYGLRGSNSTDAELSELLIHDLVQNEPRLHFRAAERIAIEDRQPRGNSASPLLGQADNSEDHSTEQGDTK